MTTDHVFNEKMRRLEPKATLCQYCKKNHSTNMLQNYFAPIFKEKNRTNLVIYRSVKFNNINIGIPRCKSCHSIHQTSQMTGWIISGVLTFVLGLILYLIYGPVAILFYAVAGPAIILVLGPKLISDFLVGRKNLPTEKQGAARDNLVVQMVNSGWTLKRPNA